MHAGSSAARRGWWWPSRAATAPDRSLWLGRLLSPKPVPGVVTNSAIPAPRPGAGDSEGPGSLQKFGPVGVTGGQGRQSTGEVSPRHSTGVCGHRSLWGGGVDEQVWAGLSLRSCKGAEALGFEAQPDPCSGMSPCVLCHACPPRWGHRGDGGGTGPRRHQERPTLQWPQ